VSHASRPAAARRRFLKSVAAAAVGTLAPGLSLVELASAAAGEGGPRWGMLVDAARCAQGCDACVRACNEENGLAPEPGSLTDSQWIHKLTVRDRATGRVTSLPLLCQHCEHPPCVDVCPTGASFKRADGVVLVDRHTCIGCRYCVMACPFQARNFVHEEVSGQRTHAPRGKGTVESCTLCVHRIDEGKGRSPACVEACAGAGHHALVFGDLADPASAVALALQAAPSRELRPDLALSTRVRYRNV
jgi:molybdopterin-containing oxidoreductase family iron-sulfur binding subunit